MDSLIKEIKQQLDAKGMTQKELAQKLDTDRSNLNKRLTSESMRVKELREVCETLGLEIVLKPIRLFESGE
jgi:transcriptional regulator with XRE-family HTH domain